MIIRHRHRSGIERISLDDIGTGSKILAVDILYHIRASKAKHIIIAFKLSLPVLKTFAAKIGFRKVISLYHSTHSTIQHQDTFFYNLLYCLCLHISL